MHLVLRSIFVHTSKRLSTYHKLLRHGADGFTYRPKEGVLWICIALDPECTREPLIQCKHASHYSIEANMEEHKLRV
jgi:hypothetical protein